MKNQNRLSDQEIQNSICFYCPDRLKNVVNECNFTIQSSEITTDRNLQKSIATISNREILVQTINIICTYNDDAYLIRKEQKINCETKLLLSSIITKNLLGYIA